MASVSTETYKRIAEHFNLPEGSEKVYWDVIDSDPEKDVYLVHYIIENITKLISNPEFTSSQIRSILNLRGNICDPIRKWNCRMSFGFTPTMSLDELPLGLCLGVDKLNNPINIDFKNAVLQPCVGGSVMGIWKYKGNVYASTHKRIYTDRSRWGRSKNFQEILLKLTGYESLEELGDHFFEKDKSSANYSINILLCDPFLMNECRMEVNTGFAVFLKTFILNNIKGVCHCGSSDFPEIEDYSDISIHPKNFLENSKFYKPTSGNNLNPPEKETIVILPNISLEEANNILYRGYSKLNDESIGKLDPRLRPGESIICHYNGGKSMCKITPKCAEWRTSILGNNSDSYNRFFKLTDSIPKNYPQDKTLRKFEEKTYEELFPILGYPSATELENIAADLYVTILNDEDNYSVKKYNEIDDDKLTKHDHLKNILYCMLFAVPVQFIEAVGSFLVNYEKDRILLEKFVRDNLDDLIVKIQTNALVNDFRFGDNQKLNAAGKRLSDIIPKSVAYSKYDYTKKANPKFKPNPNFKNHKERCIESINNFLSKEYGHTYYSLVKASKATFKVSSKDFPDLV